MEDDVLSESDKLREQLDDVTDELRRTRRVYRRKNSRLVNELRNGQDGYLKLLDENRKLRESIAVICRQLEATAEFRPIAGALQTVIELIDRGA